MDESARTGLPLPTILLQRGLVGPKDLAAALVRRARAWRSSTSRDSAVQPAAAHAVPESLARKFAAIGVEARDDSIVVAFADPADHAALAEVSAAVHAETGLTLTPAGADRQELLAAIESAYGSTDAEGEQHLVGSGIDPELHRMFERVQEIDASDLHLAAGEPPLVRVLGDLHRLTDFEVLERVAHPRARVLDHQQASAGVVRGDPRARHELHGARHRPVPRERLPEAQRGRRVLPPDPVHRRAVREARSPRGRSPLLRGPARARAGHRPDRLRQVDDARVDHRPREPAAARATSSRSKSRSSSCTSRRWPW